MTEEGKKIAVALKFKYWERTAYNELFNGLQIPKNKIEVSQRFYFFKNQPQISIDEATRFLQNKRLEKQLLNKRKQTESAQGGKGEDGTNSSGNGLIKKRKLSGSSKSKLIK